MAKPTQYSVADPPPVFSPSGRYSHSARHHASNQISPPTRALGLALFTPAVSILFSCSSRKQIENQNSPSAPSNMAESDFPNAARLTDSLHKLKIQQEAAKSDSPPTSPSGPSDTQNQQEKDDEPQVPYPRTPHSRDGYGFRKSGVNTPLKPDQQPDSASTQRRLGELVPDPNGLGWPGKYS